MFGNLTVFFYIYGKMGTSQDYDRFAYDSYEGDVSDQGDRDIDSDSIDGGDGIGGADSWPTCGVV